MRRDSNQNFGGDAHHHPLRRGRARGWGARDYTWDVSTEVQHQLSTGLSVTAGYYRNWLGNFTATDNLAVEPGGLQSILHHGAGSTRGCPAAAATRSAGLYDISPRSSATSTIW